MEQKTWFVQLVYKGQLGPLDVDIACDDLTEIDNFIRNGHDERSIISLNVVRFAGQSTAITIEEVEAEAERALAKTKKV